MEDYKEAKHHADPKHQVDLVEVPAAPDDEQQRDTHVANAVQAYQEVQEEIDRELFSNKDIKDKDINKLFDLLEQKKAIKIQLAGYGVHVRV